MFFRINIVLFLFIVFSCNSLKINDQIGEVSDGNLKITTNKGVLKKEWNNLVKDLKFESEFSSFKIIKDFDTNKKSKAYYLLVSISNDKKLKAGTLLLKKVINFTTQTQKNKQSLFVMEQLIVFLKNLSKIIGVVIVLLIV